MAKELVTLQTWAKLRYPDKQPHINTLRRWARAGLIEPKPLIHGKGYRVSVDAKLFISGSLSYE